MNLTPDPTILSPFHCGKCLEGFETRKDRDAHKYEAHGDYFREAERGFAVPFEKRKGAGIAVTPPSLPEPGDGPKVAAPVIPTKTYDDAAVAELVEALGRKFEASDMDAGLCTYALGWLKAYTGDFEFLVDLRKKAKHTLTEGQAKGVLNCWRADYFRNKAKEAEKVEAKEAKANPLPDVPEGHYAIATKDGANNTLAFYRVDRPTEGKWAGKTFVKLIVGGKPDSRVPREQVRSVLDRIAKAGPDKAGALYGQEIGRCCRCNRHLTNDESRKLGIGPECANK